LDDEADGGKCRWPIVLNPQEFRPGGSEFFGMFIPQKKESAVDVVINNIKRMLLTKELAPGDRLPNEMDLAKNLAVSRGSVREAMKIFLAFGIVEIRQGDGTYIAQSIGNVLFDPLLFSLILSQSDIRELSKFREIMEINVMELVIENAGEDDFKAIRDIYLEMESKVRSGTGDGAGLAQLDLKFHRTLGIATKNKLVEKIYVFVLEFFTPSIEKTHENQNKGIFALKIHKEILDALVDRDLERAVQAVRKSVNIWEKLLLNDLPVE
jgi:GntR family transcriptional repressor for pyruvate dehydrogenase complex